MTLSCYVYTSRHDFEAGGRLFCRCASPLGIARSLRWTPSPGSPNDNLTNAQALVGSSGIVYGDNLNATAEPSEPAPYPGNPAQASIWYLWTAPISTTMDFSTRYSTDPDGNELGTVVATFTHCRAGAPLAFANLTQIVSNEYDPSAGVTNGLVTSRVDFPVTVGHEYLIQIDGSTNTPNGSNDQGYVELNWSPSLVGGNFTFSADLNS